MTNAAVGMPCPACKVPLVMSDRQGVEIDYCPQCRGVWLDRGELDKIIERSAPQAPAAPSAPAAPAAPSAPLHPGGYDHGGYGQSGYGHGGDRGRGYPSKPYKRRKSWLEDIFD